MINLRKPFVFCSEPRGEHALWQKGPEKVPRWTA